MPVLTVEESNYLSVDDGVYVAEILSIEEFSGKFGSSLKWKFRMDHAESDTGEVVLSAVSGSRITPATKAGKWWSLLTGSIKVGDDIDTDKIIGALVEIRVENKEKDGVQYSNVVDIHKAIDMDNTFWAVDKKNATKEAEENASDNTDDDDIPF